jgi:hypothetical protein
MSDAKAPKNGRRSSTVTGGKAIVRAPGRPLKHGARALARFVRERRLDRRTWLARAIEQTEHVLATDAGGFEACSHRDRLRIALIAGVWVEWQLIAWNRQHKLIKGESTTETDKYFIALTNSTARLLEAIPDRVKEHLPSLDEYLRGRQAASNGSPDAPTPGRVPAVQSEPTAAPQPAATEESVP